MASNISDLATAISGAKFFSVRYHARGKDFCPIPDVGRRGKGDKLTYNDHVIAFQAQVIKPGTVTRLSLKLLEDLDVDRLFESLPDHEVVRLYQPDKEFVPAYGEGEAGSMEWPPREYQSLSPWWLEEARQRLIASLKDPEGRAARYTQRNTWEMVEPGIFRKVKDQSLALRVVKKPDTEVMVESEPANGYRYSIASERESRANEIVRRACTVGKIRTLTLSRILEIKAGGLVFKPDGDGSLVAS